MQVSDPLLMQHQARGLESFQKIFGVRKDLAAPAVGRCAGGRRDGLSRSTHFLPLAWHICSACMPDACWLPAQSGLCNWQLGALFEPRAVIVRRGQQPLNSADDHCSLCVCDKHPSPSTLEDILFQ